jgi:hypothetical protein
MAEPNFVPLFDDAYFFELSLSFSDIDALHSSRQKSYVRGLSRPPIGREGNFYSLSADRVVFDRHFLSNK